MNAAPPPDRAEVDAAPDPDQWRRRVAPEMERLFSPAPARAATAAAAQFPQVARPAGRPTPRAKAIRPPLEPVPEIAVPAFVPPQARAAAVPPHPRKDKARLVPIAAAALIGVAVGALGPTAYWRLDQILHAPVAAADEQLQLKPAIANAPKQAPTQANPAQAEPSAAPEAQLMLQATGEPTPNAASSNGAPPEPSPAPAEPAPETPSLSAQIATADLALAQAYGVARRAGVPEPVLENDQVHWKAVRADAARRSSISLLAAYSARIHDLHSMADEARARQAANDAGLRQQSPPAGRP